MKNFRYIKVKMIVYWTSTYQLPSSSNNYQFSRQIANASSFLLRGSHRIHLFPSSSAPFSHWRHSLIAFFQIKMMIFSSPSISRLKMSCWSVDFTSWDMLQPISIHHNQQQRWHRSRSQDRTSQASDNCKSSSPWVSPDFLSTLLRRTGLQGHNEAFLSRDSQWAYRLPELSLSAYIQGTCPRNHYQLEKTHLGFVLFWRKGIL